MNKEKTCLFTGHRRIAKNKIEPVKKALTKHIERLITEFGVNTFISGAAVGFDTLAAQCVIELKKKYPQVRLELYLPCYKQSKNWNSYDRFLYRLILSYADSYKYITESEYTDDCMQRRNMEMVKDSAFCIAFCIISGSGSGYTLRHAEQCGVEIINIADDIYE